jgi:hypothetical protein
MIRYAVWFGMTSNLKIESGLNNLWQVMMQHCAVVSLKGKNVTDFEPFQKIGVGLYLIYVEHHWSPGDICGFLKSCELAETRDEVMAIPIDQQSYLPWQGLRDTNARAKIKRWENQANEFSICQRNYN